MSLRLQSNRKTACRSSALVITLATLILVCGLLLLFLNKATASRKISFSSAGQYRSDILAHAAVDTILGDLRDEISAGSSDYVTANGTNIYVPAANVTAIPSRVNDQGFANLVKQSSSMLSCWSGSSYNPSLISPTRSAANNSTVTPSANGRYIQVGSWNAPGLLGDPTSSSSPQAPANYNPPDWILITRTGVVPNVSSLPSVAPGSNTLSDRSVGNGEYVVGRYAYTMYDEGALLDVNVSGYPSSTISSSSSFATQRGLLPQIDIANLLSDPSINDPNAEADANALVTWRNQATSVSQEAYTNFVATATNGFVGVANGDQAFVGRQDLIYFIKNNSKIPTAALPFLGTFTRQIDSPSFYPDPSRSKVSPTQDDITNPNVLTIRVQVSFDRPDGTKAVVGEPLLKHRFPLSRLGLFENPTANAALIAKYFFMQQRSDGLWDYIDPDTGTAATTLPTIKSLAAVSNENPGREPNFWELLQAGVLTGSLGANAGALNIFSTSQDASTTRQIFSIGLSLIDQYDADDTPTVLRIGGTAVTNLNDMFISGVENLPYISWIAQEHFRDNVSTLTLPTNAWIDGYLFFALWNPNRNSASALPGTFRIRCNGQTYIRVANILVSVEPTKSSPITHADTVLEFQTTPTRNFGQIDGLRPSDAILNSTSALAQFPYPAVAGISSLEVGVLMGQVQYRKTPEFPATGNLLDVQFNVPLTVVLEKLVGANWIPYQIFPNYQSTYDNNGINFANVSAQLNQPGGFTNNVNAALLAMVHSDPRTSRFGLDFNTAGVAQNMVQNNFDLINITSGNPYSYSNVQGSGSSIILADYAYNNSLTTHYSDPDGTVRKGDSNPSSTELASDTHGVDSPFAYGDARPTVLNRPFTSVAEMGYAFRDDPWRSLNFSSPDSADGGLLDLFSVYENDGMNRAGVVDLNGASQVVLAAILRNAYQDPASPSATPISAAQASAIAQAIRSQLGSEAMPAMVLKNLADIPALTDKVANALSSSLPAPFEFKFNRESFVRSFADITNVRTWNLLIDVIAQSGRYEPTAKTLNDFTVEGQKRYWVHVALDRFTGKIIEMQIEPGLN
jgi:hypothetical protein